MAVDPNEIRLTGENSFIRLHESIESDPTTQISHWRVHLSPSGIGHTLFIKSELTDDELFIYSDNIALARWLQEDIMASMNSDYEGPSIPVIEAQFSRAGDTDIFWTEKVTTDEDTISMTWYDFAEPFMVANEPGEKPNQPHGVYSLLIPAHRVQVAINEEVASGAVMARDISGYHATSCCLALSETWVLPRSFSDDPE